jgi:hypothetical protein
MADFREQWANRNEEIASRDEGTPRSPRGQLAPPKPGIHLLHPSRMAGDPERWRSRVSQSACPTPRGVVSFRGIRLSGRCHPLGW